MNQRKIAILGTVGVPGQYGGFETLADNLVRYHRDTGRPERLAVYCSAQAFPERRQDYLSAELRYLRFGANGMQSIIYDAVSLFDAARRGDDTILLLGVSGALALPFVRAVSRTRIVTNIDGIEWKREKWTGFPRLVLRWSEWAAVRWSHIVVADNLAIAEHVRSAYGKECEVIAYGGDHAKSADPDPRAVDNLPDRYALALCRIEPENNVAMILEAFEQLDENLVFVGNWASSKYGRDLKARFANVPNIILHDPVYEAAHLRAIRDRATAYLHGHSAGGTNPSLVEMMHFGIPVFAYDCNFNRNTTEGKALYFSDARELQQTIRAFEHQDASKIGSDMQEIAARRYTWEQIGKDYFDLLET